MTPIVKGTVRNGVVAPDEPINLPDGTRVEVVIAEAVSGSSLQNGLLKLAGTVNDLPPDFAEQHDHYIHGTPKR